MAPLSRFSFALTGLFYLLAASSISTAGADIVKRAPDFIENWELFRRWQVVTDSIPEFDAPEVTDVTQATFDKAQGKLTWTCNTLTLGEQLSALTSIIQRATLAQASAEAPGAEVPGVEVPGGEAPPAQGTEQEVLTKRSRSEARELVYGAKLQRGIEHDNILPVIDIVSSVLLDGKKSFAWVIMPWVPEGSLETNFDAYPDQGALNDVFKQILSAVVAVSDAGIIHRDLKPENFVKDGDTLKLIDFDQATESTESNVFNVGTPSYTAPEIIAMVTDDGPDYTSKADTFSTAMTFMVMSVPDVRDATARFQLWKDLIEPDGRLWPTAETVAELLRSKNYPVFQDNDALLQVLAKALCKPSERYTPQEFRDAFNAL